MQIQDIRVQHLGSMMTRNFRLRTAAKHTPGASSFYQRVTKTIHYTLYLSRKTAPATCSGGKIHTRIRDRRTRRQQLMRRQPQPSLSRQRRRRQHSLAGSSGPQGDRHEGLRGPLPQPAHGPRPPAPMRPVLLRRRRPASAGPGHARAGRSVASGFAPYGRWAADAGTEVDRQEGSGSKCGLPMVKVGPWAEGKTP
jgi:hypothetical protein